MKKKEKKKEHNIKDVLKKATYLDLMMLLNVHYPHSTDKQSQETSKLIREEIAKRRKT